ncbi:MAG TPA: translocation/assembly module TamB domain-containing protein, partial [Candidatus Wallbacteria bacterium]|nr:translocation/assembly module TamB domain-containing protein [Candidatus Wallbacteria bacterium]
LENISGETDIEFSGQYSFISLKNELNCSLFPKNCSVTASKFQNETLLLKTGEVKIDVSADAAGVKYNINANGLKAYARNKNIDISGFFKNNDHEIKISFPSLTSYDVEQLLPRSFPAFIKKSLPDSEGKIIITPDGIKAEGRIIPSINGWSAPGGIKILSGNYAFSDRGSDKRSLSVSLSVEAPLAGRFELSMETKNIQEFEYFIKNIGSGHFRFLPLENSYNVDFEGIRQGKSEPLKILAGGEALENGHFNVSVSNIPYAKIASLLFTGNFKNIAGAVPAGAVINAQISGYFEKDRLISRFFLSSGSRQAKNSANIEGAFSISGFPEKINYDICTISTLETASSIFLPAVKLKIPDFIRSEQSTFSLTADPSSLKMVFECGAGKAIYDGGMVKFQISPTRAFTVKGEYEVATRKIIAEAFVNEEAAGVFLKKILAFSGIRKLSLRSAAFDPAEIEVSSEGPIYASSLGFSFRLPDFSREVNEISLKKLKFTSKQLEFSGEIKSNMKNNAIVISGVASPKELPFYFGIGRLLAVSPVKLNIISTPAMFSGDGPLLIKAEKFLEAGHLNLACEAKVENLSKTSGASVSFDVTNVKAERIFSINVGQKSAEKEKNCYYVSYSIKGTEFLNALYPFISEVFLKPEVRPLVLNYLSEIQLFEVRGTAKLEGFKLNSHYFELSATGPKGMSVSGTFNMENNGVYSSKLFNFSFANTTYRGECELNFKNLSARIKGKNNKCALADILEKISGEKNSLSGFVTINHEIAISPVGIDFKADCEVSDAKLEVEKLTAILSKKKAGKLIGNINLTVSMGVNNYIITPTLQAMVEGKISVNGIFSAPVVSGNLEIQRGRIDYFNKLFNITSGNFSISTLQNVSTVIADNSVEEKKKVGVNNKPTGFNYSLASSNLSAVKGPSNYGQSGETCLELYMNISAEAKVKEYDIYLTLSGNSNRLNSFLTSKPELSQDAIHMLLYGMTPTVTSTSLGRDDQITSTKVIGALNSKFQDTIYQKLSSSLEKKLNLDELRINPYTAYEKTLIGGNDSNSKTLLPGFSTFTDVQVKIGKYIDPDLYLSYSKNFHSSKDDSLGMEYKVKEKFLIDGNVNQNLEYSLGAKYGIPF